MVGCSIEQHTCDFQILGLFFLSERADTHISPLSMDIFGEEIYILKKHRNQSYERVFYPKTGFYKK